MKVYLVGGAVRDELLGRQVNDLDYVVVGSTPEEMLSLGYTQVGADFPVFLHPETKEEYALARTERQNGEGHKGFITHFSPDVTLEEDLARRDLTINAIAKDPVSGMYIDPFGGMSDLVKKRLVATTDAFVEDPLRILRLFRFKSQLGEEWTIEGRTMILAWENRHRLAEIAPERKWKEMEKALHSRDFAFFVEMMCDFEQLPEVQRLLHVEQPPEHHPEGDAYKHTILCLKMADKMGTDALTKFAVMCHDLGKHTTFVERGNLLGHEEAGVPLVELLCARLKIPNNYRDTAKFVAENHTRVHCIVGRDGSGNAKPKTIMKIIEAAGNIRADFTEEKIYALADACWCDARGRGPTKMDEAYWQGHILLDAFTAAKKVDTGVISKAMLDMDKSGIEIGEAIRVARIDAIRKVSNSVWGHVLKGA